MTRRLLLCLALLASVAGCPSPSSSADGGAAADGGRAGDAGEPAPDAGAAVDAGDEVPPDAGVAHDAGPPPDDGGTAASDAGALDAGAAADAGVVITPEATAYCECVFVACHDDFHETFGIDDLESIAACQTFASALPTVGMVVLTGNNLECRQHWCDAVPTDCPSALGLNATCSDG
jgi:hypothetical protein